MAQPHNGVAAIYEDGSNVNKAHVRDYLTANELIADVDSLLSSVVQFPVGQLLTVRHGVWEVVASGASVLRPSDGLGFKYLGVGGQPRLSGLVGANGTATEADIEHLLAEFGECIIDMNVTTSSMVSAPDGSRIVIDRGAVWTNMLSDFIRPQGNFALMVKNGFFVGADNNAVVRPHLNEAQRVTIEFQGNSLCQDVALIATEDNGLTYDTLDYATQAIEEIEIIRPKGICTTGNSARPFIQLRFLKAGTVLGGFSVGFRHGVAWWGGDSNPSVDGAVGNERKCGKIRIDLHIVYQPASTNPFSGAAIWGSMGIDVVVTSCAGYGDGVNTDVGGDSEGGANTIFSNCHFEGFKNGNFASFFNQDGYHAINCSSRGPVAFRLYNSSLDPDNATDIELIEFKPQPDAGATEPALVDANNGPASNITIKGGIFKDTRINLIVPNGQNGSVDVSDVRVVIETTFATAFDAIRVGKCQKGSIVVERNKTDYRGAATVPAGSRFIYAQSSAANRSLIFAVNDNKDLSTVTGQSFDQGIVAEELGTNVGTSGRFTFCRNMVAGINVDSSGGAKNAIIGLMEHNQTQDMTPIVVNPITL